MYYLYGAAVIYVITAMELVRGARPESWREVIAGVLGCALVAALWPPVLLWGLLVRTREADG